MRFLRSLMRKFVGSQKTYPDDYWPSVVVLLRAPAFPTSEDVLMRAQACWGAHAPVEAIGTASTSHVLRCGAFFFSVHYAAERYSSIGEEGLEILQRPWTEHTAWMSVDMPNQRCKELKTTNALGDSYKLLLIYAFKSWSEDCLGVHFPAEGITIPNFGDLAQSIQWGRRNGLDLTFLN
jgi:hypothetical protein